MADFRLKSQHIGVSEAETDEAFAGWWGSHAHLCVGLAPELYQRDGCDQGSGGKRTPFHS
jgi:hypothetical protein